MGNEQSLLKMVASAKKRKDTTFIVRGDLIDPEWIPEDDLLQMKLEIVKLIEMRFVTVPTILFQLDSIKQLDLSSNMLVSVTGIGSLVNLTDLDLSHNRLDYLPDDLSNCKNLWFLNLSQNLLNIRSLPLFFFQGKRFAAFDISENKFDTMTPELITLLNSIESVSIHSNPWDIVELKDLGPHSSEEHVKTLLKLLKSTVLASERHGVAYASPPYINQKDKGPAANQKKEKIGHLLLDSYQNDSPSIDQSSTTGKKKDSIVNRISIGFVKPKKELSDSEQVGSPIFKNNETVETPKGINSPPISPTLRSDTAKSINAPPPVPKDSIVKRVSIGFVKPKIELSDSEQVGSPIFKNNETVEIPKGINSPPISPTLRSDTAKSINVPPPVPSKSPAAAASAPSRTQNALKSLQRPAGPKGRKPPTNEFIENNAHEDGEESASINKYSREKGALSKTNKSEASFSSTVSIVDKAAPPIPSKTTRPDKGSSPNLTATGTPSIHSNVNEIKSIKEDESDKDLSKREASTKEREKNLGIEEMKDQPIHITSVKHPVKKNPNTRLNDANKADDESENKTQASDAPAAIKRPNLADVFNNPSPEQTDSPVKKPGAKKPVGGVSLFGGAVMPNNEDISKKNAEISVISYDVPIKEQNAPPKKPKVPQKDAAVKIETNAAPTSPKFSKKTEHSATAVGGVFANPSSVGKKPPIGGVSIFGGPPIFSISSAATTANETKEELQEVQNGSSQNNSLKNCASVEMKGSSSVPPIAVVSPKKGNFLSEFNNQSPSDDSKESTGHLKKDVLANEEVSSSQKKTEFSPRPQPNTVQPATPAGFLSAKKPPAGGISIFGGAAMMSDASLKDVREEQGVVSNSGTWKRPPPGAVSMFGGVAMPMAHRKESSNLISEQPNSDSNLESTSEMRVLLKQQLSSNNHTNSAPAVKPKPHVATLPRSFKPSDAADTPPSVLPLPAKPSAAKSVDKLMSK